MSFYYFAVLAVDAAFYQKLLYWTQFLSRASRHNFQIQQVRLCEAYFFLLFGKVTTSLEQQIVDHCFILTSQWVRLFDFCSFKVLFFLVLQIKLIEEYWFVTWRLVSYWRFRSDIEIKQSWLLKTTNWSSERICFFRVTAHVYVRLINLSQSSIIV